MRARAMAVMALWWIPAAAGQPACDTAALQQQGREAMAHREYREAVRRYRQALQACPVQSEVLLELSDASAHARDFPGAIEAARQFLAGAPNSVPGRLALANAYFMAQKFEDARREADAVLKAEPGQPTALKLKANIAFLAGPFEQAESILMDLLERHPNDAEASYMLGRMYYQKGRIDYAIGQFERVLKIDPESYKAYDNLGLCYQARSENELAIRYFLTAIKLVERGHRDYDWPYANLASLLIDQGDAQRGFAAASQAANLNPLSARDFYIGGKALARLGKKDLAVNWLERSVSLDPAYPEPLYLLARVYDQLGQHDKSKAALERFRSVKSKTSSAPK